MKSGVGHEESWPMRSPHHTRVGGFPSPIQVGGRSERVGGRGGAEEIPNHNYSPSRRRHRSLPYSRTAAMVSDASKKKAAQKKAAAAAKRGAKASSSSSSSSSAADKAANGIAALKLSDRTCTGVLASHPLSRDIHIESLSLTFHGHDLIVDSELELNYGRRYGLLGLNGCGKSTLLTAIGCRELPIPEHMDIYHLSSEIEASDMSALQAVICCDEERMKLEKEAEILSAQDDGGGDALDRIYERLEALDASTAEKRAAEILFGLGFNKQMQAKKTQDFSGGWRMRIALARALFMNPTILLLDEPTNHLDLEACVWLEETLKKFDRILVVISHSQDFLNGVCTNIIHMQSKKLKLYSGNYDQYVQTRSELEENQMKQYKWEQEQIASMKEYIARFGHGSAKLARQAQSKEKTLAKMERGGLTEKVVRDKVLVFRFTDVGKLPPPVLQFVEVSFGYTPDNLIYKNLDFGVDLDSRIALVGPNGAGKSTLLKLMTGDLAPLDGMVRRHNHLRIAQYHQHLAEKLDLDMPALQYMMREYPGNEEEKMRAAIGKFGLSGKAQVMPMRNLSDGQRSRVIFAWLAYRQPQLLLLDEPTNHLDIETIDSLAEALNEWDGGLVLVSHDFRLINQVAQEIWVCEKQAVTRWEGDIMDFKEHLRSRAGLSD
jgi:ATP-binding cassette subfamily F protein 2